MEDKDTRNYVESIVEHTARPIVDADVDGHPYAVIPERFKVQDLAHMLQAPPRAKGMVALHDTDSFCAYVNSLQFTEEPATIYCDMAADGTTTFTALFNDHRSGAAGWRDHGATYALPKSVEWHRWTQQNAKSMQQAAFATFLEDNMRDIAGPTEAEPTLPNGAAMLQLALALEINNDNSVKSAVRLQSGAIEMTYVNKEDEATLKKMQVFERFAIGIPVFVRSQSYRINARLRYRVANGAVSFWYELIRLDLVIADAVKDAVTKIAEATKVPVWYGKP